MGNFTAALFLLDCRELQALNRLKISFCSGSVSIRGLYERKSRSEAQAPRGIKVKGVEYKRSEMGTNKVATNYSPILV